MKRVIGTVMVSVGAIAASGCLHMETAHRLYLSPGGGVTWTVQQSDVRSDIDDPGRRREEEARFLTDSESDSHPVGLAFHTLGAGRVRTQVLRPARPFAVTTTADFGRVDDMVNRFLRELSLEGRAVLARNDAGTTLTIAVRRPGEDIGYDGTLMALVEDLQQYRIVLTAGRFVEAEGFSLSADGAVATPAVPDTPADTFHFSLTWRE